ncbi:uncharacterized protein zgc:113229 isoform X2 [Takifugu flavidus]|uniref:uncharacterized protein zgc:113229 isoform X2 n=1 Tax=Takifugu flavidus TaxID=433684 RepID=UPI002544BDB3|nr:uncharacterized protein zgc:113229 isoform X2 [Takifugu flavidus]
MSQSPNSTDTQAVLQSMLQRLKIQQGKDSATQQHTHVPISTVSTCAEGVAEASSVQKLNNGPVGGHEFGSNGIPSRLLTISEAGQSLSLKDEVAQKPVLNWEVNKGHISFPVHKDQSDGGTSQNRVMGQDTQLRIPPAETGQRVPAELPKEGNATSNRAEMQTVNIGGVTVSSTEQTWNQGFQPKVFAWSSSPTHAAGTPRYRVLPLENGEFSPSTDTHMTATGFSRNQQSTGNKTRRWTQRIKARWKDRQGSFGKKQKEEQRDAKQIGQQAELLRTNSIISASNGEEEAVVSPPGPSDPIKTALTCTEDTKNEARTSDFEFGLGSFSLLEEISSGQEWANFLTPNLTPASADLRPLPKVRRPTFSTQSLIPNHSSDDQRGSHDRGATSFSDISVAQTWPGCFQPVSMDISEEQQGVQRESEQTELMEHRRAPSDVRIRRQTTPLPLSQCADIQNNSWMKRRIQMNRKRHHHLTERTEEDLQIDVNHPDREGIKSSWSSCEMGVSGAPHHDIGPPVYMSPPLSPSFSPSLASPPKGVLKHSISQDSQSSVEILTKRRRVEDNRHVRFFEQVVTIMPPELDPDWSDPEEDSRIEEDSLQELEREEERSEMEDVAPARRSTLPAWILSLKKMNSQRKHRK